MYITLSRARKITMAVLYRMALQLHSAKAFNGMDTSTWKLIDTGLVQSGDIANDRREVLFFFHLMSPSRQYALRCTFSVPLYERSPEVRRSDSNQADRSVSIPCIAMQETVCLQVSTNEVHVDIGSLTWSILNWRSCSQGNVDTLIFL
jgi:hypothetical protein